MTDSFSKSGAADKNPHRRKRKKFPLNSMNLPEDLRDLSYEECEDLAFQIRSMLVNTISVNGGHLASNLGTVELTIALHRVFETPADKIVWDVGHQAYTHKILTGRADRFDTLRKKDGIGGFPRPDESEYDSFISGHSSVSVSAALGIAAAMRLRNDPHHTAAVLGDGAFTGGEIYEGLNNAGKSDTRLVIVLNYNEMSISKNVGALAKYLSELRTKESYLKTKSAVENVLDITPIVGSPAKKIIRSWKDTVKNMVINSTMFEDLGFEYVGPIDGHSVRDLEEGLKTAKSYNKPTIVMVNTVKGKGYPPAEANPGEFHGVGSFEIATGNPDVAPKDSYSTVFGKKLLSLAEADERICAVTAAMKHGTGLQFFAGKLPHRFFDVGIAEQHAVTFCAGLASQGMIPVFAVYSSFLQRSYDQIIHDMAIMNTHAVIGVDRAGIVGEDGETHQGIFDVPFLTTVPNMTIYSPSDYRELEVCLEKAVFSDGGICAVRYPRGSQRSHRRTENVCAGYELIGNGSDTLAVTYGRLFDDVYQAREILRREGLDFDILKLVKIFPLSGQISEIIKSYEKAVFFEECYKYGSIGEKYAAVTRNCACEALDGFVTHGITDELLDMSGLSPEKIAHRMRKAQIYDKT